MAQLDLLSAAPSHVPLIPISIMESSLPEKAEGAYKTISEVSDEIGVPQHVLRFWESHFPQVKPSRMRGSRRYYRPEDVYLLKTIKTLLYSKGYTIKGAKKVVREGKETLNETVSLRAVASASPPLFAIEKTAPVKSAVRDKKLDTQSLVTELRVLKSMLTSLL